MENSKNLNTNWRKVASAIYRKPTDSKVFGSVELDVTELENFVSEKRKQGLKITLTHFMVLTVARALKQEIPEFNTFVRRGKIVHRPSIDAMVSVLQADGQMGSIKIPNADTLNLESLVSVMTDEIQKSRRGDENSAMQSKDILSSIPWPFRNWFFRLYKMITINWGMSIPFLGLSSDSFGSYVITNIGSIGLETGFPALLPSSNVAFVLVMGGISKKPVVVNDEIVIRRIMSLSIVMDHRLVDASHGGKLFRFIKYMVKHPQELE
ncbi:MAG: dehydrogenase [Bacteroidetes bacterium GWF2_42_66]|nr:MAG: dehydrogenase [Bacteroidetes bacterium GWA2_42_15]OFY02206.1 MAG: dehydrogenase [Bacteroidetes bacterium GWE2_42_39]OFY43653.1 MAG: dehydrogenase [Bacteroidetes bacterium GWF2_42_66]HBL75287.1 dehydrogenase [Prolixibacteraceae bacterium]HCR90420.1 dehydrogenase [Prolixibacteraceae bacterium]